MAGRKPHNPVQSSSPVFNKNIERVTTESKEVHSDLYKLTVAAFLKREGMAMHPDENPSDFIEAEHVHFFRTYDSEGRKMDRCSSIGNHFHVITTAPNPENPKGPPMIVEVSGPMQMGKKKKQGRWVLEPVPLNDYDHHTHGIEYHRSSLVKTRELNLEAQKVIAYESAKGSQVPGVQEN